MTSSDKHMPHYPIVDMVLDAIADWVNKYRDAAGITNELDRCGSDQVRAMANDLGMTAADLRTLASQGPESADLLKRMLVALHVDPAVLEKIDPRMTRELQRSCITCGEKRRCRHELADGTAARNMHQFCPNAPTLQTLFGMGDSR